MALFERRDDGSLVKISRTRFDELKAAGRKVGSKPVRLDDGVIRALVVKTEAESTARANEEAAAIAAAADEQKRTVKVVHQKDALLPETEELIVLNSEPTRDDLDRLKTALGSKSVTKVSR